MNGWGCFGLIVGALVGLLALVIFMIILQPVTPVLPAQPATAADVTLFLSEQSLSRAASVALATPTVVDCEPGGQLLVTTRVRFGELQPVVDLSLTLEQQGGTALTRLYWARLAFLKIPADWLPAEIAAAGAIPGQTLTRQIPSQFTLTGLTTTADGLTLDLAWNGQ